MKRLWVSATVTGLMCALAVAVPVSAQETPRVEVSGGYQLAALQSDVDETMEKGWYADVAANINRVLGVVFQVGGNYKTIEERATFDDVTATLSADLKVHQFMGGVRANARTRNIVPFAEFLVGGVNASVNVEGSVVGDGETFISVSAGDSATDLAIQAGGGATFRLSDHLGARAAVAYLRVFGEDQDPPPSDCPGVCSASGDLDIIRFTAGIVVGF